MGDTDGVAALGPLREVARALARSAGGRPLARLERERAAACARRAGRAALPSLVRSLASADAAESRFAAWLLVRMDAALVGDRLGALLDARRLDGRALALALDVLADLGMPIPLRHALAHPELALAARLCLELERGDRARE